MLESNYMNCLADRGGAAKADATVGVSQRIQNRTRQDRAEEEQPLWIGSFVGPKIGLNEGFPNSFPNGADIREKAIQKLIDKWIPICIALAADFQCFVYAKTEPK